MDKCCQLVPSVEFSEENVQIAGSSGTEQAIGSAAGAGPSGLADHRGGWLALNRPRRTGGGWLAGCRRARARPPGCRQAERPSGPERTGTDQRLPRSACRAPRVTSGLCIRCGEVLPAGRFGCLRRGRQTASLWIPVDERPVIHTVHKWTPIHPHPCVRCNYLRTIRDFVRISTVSTGATTSTTDTCRKNIGGIPGERPTVDAAKRRATTGNNACSAKGHDTMPDKEEA